jgi:hypothetical protein
MQALDIYEDYTKNQGAELREKIAPKTVREKGKDISYVVKTYPIGQPADIAALAKVYAPVEASRSLDIWSFGTIMFALCVGKPLFPVNRDDDLDGGGAMKSLHDWTDDLKFEKLQDKSLVADPLARDLLSKLLSKDPDERHRFFPTMGKVLEHGFFQVNSTAASSEDLGKKMDELKGEIMEQFKQQEKMLGAQKACLMRIEDNTIVLKAAGQETQRMISQSSSVLCKAIFEATEVLFPACFVMLPYKLPDPDFSDGDEVVVLAESGPSAHLHGKAVVVDRAARSDGEVNIVHLVEDDQAKPLRVNSIDLVKKVDESLSVEAGKWIELVKGLMVEEVEVANGPRDWTKNIAKKCGKHFKDKWTKKTYYLYLVDEFTHKPVWDPNETYPIVIKEKSDLVKKYLPVMKAGLLAMSAANGVAAIGSMFYPFVPSRVVPAALQETAQDFVKGLQNGGSEFAVVQDTIDAGNDGGEAKRGPELREFQKFLQKEDKQQQYANLRRVCDASGNAIWVTGGSAKQLQWESVRGETAALGDIGASSEAEPESNPSMPPPPYVVGPAAESSGVQICELKAQIAALQEAQKVDREAQKVQISQLFQSQKAQTEAQKAQTEAQKAQMEALTNLILGMREKA